jgi:glycosyltransferase involved in cell wall biosynthesis
MTATAEHSYGHLPLPPLHRETPTAVGYVDLDGDAKVLRPDPAPPLNAVDQVVLVRLHGEPVAIIELGCIPDTENRTDVFAAAWDDGETEIVDHARRCGCIPVPGDATQLEASLAEASHECPEQVPPRPPGHVAVILCTIGRPETLRRTLTSLANMRFDDWEIIVVDNRPGVGTTRELVESIQAPVSIRYVPESRVGGSYARNCGAEAATGATYVAYTDDDVIVDERWLSWIIAPFIEPGVEEVTGMVLPIELKTMAQKRFELYAGFGKGIARESYVLNEKRDHIRFKFLYPYWGGMFGSGNSMAFNRDSLLGIGGFDTALGPGSPTGGAEDLTAFTDVILAGGKLIYEPRSVCWHEHRRDDEGLRAQVRNYGIGLTAMFWRYLWRDPHFILTVARSIPLMGGLLRARSTDRSSGRTDPDLAHIETQGRWFGPWLYVVSRRQARRIARRG